MQDLLAIWLLLMLALTLAWLAVSIAREMIQEYRARRAWEKKIQKDQEKVQANRDEIFLRIKGGE